MPDKLYILMQDGDGDCLICHGAFTTREKLDFYIIANFKNAEYDSWCNYLGDGVYEKFYIIEGTVQDWTNLREQIIKKKLKKEK